MEKKCPKGCCKDEQKIIKIEKDQKNSEPAFQFTNVYTDVITPDYATLSIGRIPSIVEDYPTAHAPPRRRGTPIFILNCNFRI
jgi:hypothetical protein